MNNDKYIERRKNILKILIPLFVIALIGIVIYSVSTLIYRAGKSEVAITYAPFAAKVSLNNQRVKNNATQYIKPGSYHLVVEFDNFEKYEEDIKISEGKNEFFGALLAINAEGEEYIKSHISEFYKINSLAGQNAEQDGKALSDRWPLLAQLPIKDPHYTIDYNISSDGEARLAVTASLAYRSVAVSELLSILSGEDLEKYDIIISDLNSPFTADFIQNTEIDALKFLQKGYGNAMSGFELWKTKESDGYLYGVIRKKAGSYYEMYRFVLKKSDAGWQLCGAPYPVLTGKNTPNVPKEILHKANTSDFN